MPSKLSLHLISTHRDGHDLDVWRAWQPPVAKLFRSEWSDRNLVNWLMTNLPRTLFQFRDWDMDRDQDATYARVPEDVAHEHAGAFERNLRQHGYWDWRDRIVVSGLNEPRVWTHRDWTVRYYAAFVRRCTALGMRAAALCLSVGWPDNTGPDTPVDWAPYEPVHQAIREGHGQHVLVLHEYWDIAGPRHNWRWWAGRYLQCPWQVPIIIGECGVDRAVASGEFARPDRLQERGFHKWLSQEQYLSQLAEYDRELRRDARVLGACVFTYDYGNNEWASFDVRPMRDALVRYVEEQRTVPDPIPTDGVIDAPSRYYSSRQGRRVEWIVVHSAEAPAGGTPEGTLKWLTDHPANTGRVSSHELVAEDGRVWRLVRDEWASHHAEGAGAQLPGVPHEWTNESSWGIEAHNIAWTPVPARAVELLVQRVAAACRRFGLSSSRVLGHREMQPGKHDPTGVDMNWFRRRIAVELGEQVVDPFAGVGPGVKAAMQARGDTPAGPERYIGDWMSITFARTGRMYVYQRDRNAVAVYEPAA